MRFTSAEGASGNRPLGWIGIANLADSAQTVTVTLIPESGSVQKVTRVLEPMKRAVVETHAMLSQGQPFATLVECDRDCTVSLVLWDKLVRDPLVPQMFAAHKCIPVPQETPYTIHR